MMRVRSGHSGCVFLAVVFVLGFVAGSATAQRKGEYLTEGELNLVRDIQEIDLRSEIFLKVADRRLTAMVDPAGPTGESRMKKYGPLPTGTPVELLDDYRRTVEELMIKLDDEFERTGITAPLKKALELSASEMDRQLSILATLKSRSTDAAYVSFHRRAVEAANDLREGARDALRGGTASSSMRPTVPLSEPRAVASGLRTALQ